MAILGIIMIVVGLTLMIVGRNVANNLPPGYQEDDDSFLQLLQSMGNLLKGAGVVFIITGLGCIVWFMMLS